jgi:hypothetical protein
MQKSAFGGRWVLSGLALASYIYAWRTGSPSAWWVAVAATALVVLLRGYYWLAWGRFRRFVVLYGIAAAVGLVIGLGTAFID